MQASSYLKVSVGVALATIALKTGAWWVTGSVSLLSDALEGLVNLAGAAFALGMVSWAAQPPDAEHPYGHHKAEYFSSGFEGVLILAAAIAILGAAGERLLHPAAVQSLGPGLALSIVATAMNAALAAAMFRKAATDRSIALEADARHLMADVWTSVGVVVGLVGVHFTGWLWLDPVVALCVAANILREGVSLVWRSAGGLMDMAVEPEVRAQIERTLAGFAHHAIRFDHVVTRRAGQRRYVDLHMHLPAEWSLGRAAALRADVEAALMADVAGLRATIQLLPMDVEAHVDETAEDVARRAQARRAQAGQAVADAASR
jgi:cation diffusion facilitator family transporter